MKINLNEKYFYAILVIIVTFLSLTLVTPRSDNYSAYYISREFLRNPSFLWNYVDEVRSPVIAGGYGKAVYNYPPLTMFLYSVLILFSLPPILLTVISFLIIVFFTYKLNNKAVPLLFISFLFLRSVIQGESDVFISALALSSIYFFDRSPIISGIFAALAYLSKQTGLLVVAWFILSILIFKRRELKLSFRSNHILSIIIVLLLISVWFARNYALNEGDIIGTITGQKLSSFQGGEQFLAQGVQTNSPETFFIDTSGYYPNPIDVLLILGVIFLVYDIYKKKKLDQISLFVVLSLLVYITVQALSIRTLMTIRYYLFMFPPLAIIMARNLNEKYFKYLMIVTIVIFVFYIFNLQTYAFNQLKVQVDEVCPEIKRGVDMKPVYVDFFHHLFLAYECDLNLTDLNHSEYIVNLTSGTVYPTNKTS